MSSSFKYLAKMGILAVGLMGAFHVVTSAAVATYATWAFPTRIFDVHKFGDGAQAPTLVSAFIGSSATKNVVAVGSSFTLGYPYDEQYSFTAELNRRGLTTLNLGVTGLGLNGVHDWELCAMKQRNIRPKSLIVEIPLINDVSWLTNHKDPDAGIIKTCPATKTVSLFTFALSHPIGTGWAKVLFDHFGLAEPQPKISISKPPDGYLATAKSFRRIEHVLRANIQITYETALSISDNVIMFVTPVYLDGLAQAEVNRDDLSEQINRAQDFCREAAGEGCLDLSDIAKNSNNFANLTHFNATGAKALANLIAPKIVR